MPTLTQGLISTSVFPLLSRYKLEAIDLAGKVKASQFRLDALIKQSLRVTPTPNFEIAANYQDGKHTNSCRISMNYLKEDAFIKVRVRNTKTARPLLKLDDEGFLGFFRDLSSTEHIQLSSFAVTASFRFPLTTDIRLPFDAKPKTPVFVSGIRYGFDGKSTGNLKSVIIEMVGDDRVHVVVTSNPVFGLVSNLINEHFFDAVIDFACRSKDAMLNKNS